MSVIRAFVAIDLTPEIRLSLNQVINQLKERLGKGPVRWVPVENIHLTLKFLGDVSLANLELLQQALEREVSNHRQFEIGVGGLGAFPNIHRPRVIWVGVEAPPDLSVIQRGIEAEMERLGYAKENKTFSPHLTLGRVSHNVSPEVVRKIGEALETLKVGFIGAACVREILLIRSDLRPSGAIYTCLFSAKLL